MSSNVGLSTPRGSGTSGYVQRNLSLLKPRDNWSPYPDPSISAPHKPRKPDQQILNHDRLREIEVKVFDLRDKLEEEGLEDEEIEEQTQALREKLLKEREGGKRRLGMERDGVREGKGGEGKGEGEGREVGGRKEGRRQFKTHQVHEQAEAKVVESEKLRKALGISKDYEEGAHWRRKEERLRDSLGGDER